MRLLVRALKALTGGCIFNQIIWPKTEAKWKSSAIYKQFCVLEIITNVRLLMIHTFCSYIYDPCHAMVLTLTTVTSFCFVKRTQSMKLSFNFVLNSRTYKSVYIWHFPFPECLPGGNVSWEWHLSWLCMALCDSGNIHVIIFRMRKDHHLIF